jgi:RNA polymerase sigma-70 factor (ECF subfamily)
MSEGGFSEFYAANYRGLVAQLALVTADLAEAEDLTQESFARAYARWSTVSGYEDPAGWVRSVGYRLAVSRWRRARVAARHLWQFRAHPETSIELERFSELIAELPVAQRQVLMLHYVVGLPVAEIAQELGVATGTVKSRLMRARRALAFTTGGAEEATSR